MQQYVDLHIHSEYTRGNGLTRIPELVDRALTYGMNALALVDSATIDGFPEFTSECKRVGVKPIYGCGFYFTPGSRFNQVDEKYHLVLLAENNPGLDTLKTLVRLSKEDGFFKRPRIDFELLEKYGDGLIALTGGLGGLIDKMMLSAQLDKAKSYLLKFREILGENNIFIELQNNGLEKNLQSCSLLHSLSEETGVPMVVSGGSFYLDPEDAMACNTLRRSSGNGELKGDGYTFKSPEEIYALFPYDTEAIQNSVIIAERCSYSTLA